MSKKRNTKKKLIKSSSPKHVKGIKQNISS